MFNVPHGRTFNRGIDDREDFLDAFEFNGAFKMRTDLPESDGQKLAAIRTIHTAFKEIMQKAQCRHCACFHADVLTTVRYKIRSYQAVAGDPCLQPIQKDFDDWLDRADTQKMNG